jgi:hypothetical protein
MNVRDIFLQMFIPNMPQNDPILPESVGKRKLLLSNVDLSQASDLVLANEALWTGIAQLI